MRQLLIAFSLIATTTYFISCRHSSSAILDYQKLIYDTGKIFIFKWDTTKYLFATNSEPLPLTQDDLTITDSLLKDAVDSFNRHISPAMYEAFEKRFSIDSFVIKQEKYKFQYYPYLDVNGQRIITIIGFSTDFPYWKDKVYQPRHHYGMGMLQLKVNLSEKTRDNLISGDFG